MKHELSLQQWQKVKDYAIDELNLSSISKADCDLTEYIPYYNQWIKKGYHADLDYMVKHGSKRCIPD